MGIISGNNHNDKRELTDLEWCNELYDYLQNKPLPEESGIPNTSGIKLSDTEAFRVIWFLQEHLRVLPDNIERCDVCGDLYDSNQEGTHLEEPFDGNHSFCSCCNSDIPDEYDPL
jgi:hypothetical protein